MTTIPRLGSLLLILLLGSMLASCAGSSRTSFLHDEYDFGFLERTAIVPFENQSDDRGAGARATNIFLTEILASRALEVVEPGEVTRVLSKHSVVRTAELSTEQIIAIGQELKVQGLFLGTVNESESYRSGGSTVAKVTMTVRLVETERGVTIWTSSATSGGRGFFASLFGAGNQSTSEVTRSCTKKILGSLFR